MSSVPQFGKFQEKKFLAILVKGNLRLEIRHVTCNFKDFPPAEAVVFHNLPNFERRHWLRDKVLVYDWWFDRRHPVVAGCDGTGR